MKKKNRAIFCLSSGRSGTQWLCDLLDRVFGDLVVATHEPLKRAYWPNRYLRRSEEYPSSPYYDELDRHIVWIEEILAQKIYVETGWPCFPAIPWLREKLGDRVGVIQILRNPVHAAASLVTHGFFEPDLKTEVALHGQLAPCDPGIVGRCWASGWEKLTPFEKCLFHWSEIHRYGMEIEATMPRDGFLRVKSEDLFAGNLDTFAALLNFIDLPTRPEAVNGAKSSVDRYRARSDRNIEWAKVFDHPDVVSLAETFGYDLGEIRPAQIQARYGAAGWLPRAMHRLKAAPARYRRKLGRFLKNW